MADTGYHVCTHSTGNDKRQKGECKCSLTDKKSKKDKARRRANGSGDVVEEIRESITYSCFKKGGGNNVGG